VELYLSNNALTVLDLRLFQNDFVNELVDTHKDDDGFFVVAMTAPTNKCINSIARKLSHLGTTTASQDSTTLELPTGVNIRPQKEISS
jgi:hypothetical protein